MDTWADFVAAVRAVAACLGSCASCVVAIAVSVGGLWTLREFLRTRQPFPRAQLEHQVFEKKLTDNKRLLHVVARIANSGEVLLVLRSGFTRVQQVLPVPPTVAEDLANGRQPIESGQTDINWPLIEERQMDEAAGSCEIEPGETDELCFDFVVESEVETIMIYSYLENVRKRGRRIGWAETTLYDLDRDGGDYEQG